MSGRRQLTAAVLGTALAGGLALFAGGQRWAEVTVVRAAPLPPVSGALTGGSAAPLVPAVGLLLLAAAVALIAVRGVARVAVGVLAGLAGAGLVWAAAGPLTGRVDTGAARVPVLSDAFGSTRADVAAGWPAAVVVAGMLAVATGALVVLRGRGWPAMGRRYQRPGDPAGQAAPARPTRAPSEEERAQAAWRALDRGEDPTEPASDAPGSGAH